MLAGRYWCLAMEGIPCNATSDIALAPDYRNGFVLRQNFQFRGRDGRQATRSFWRYTWSCLLYEMVRGMVDCVVSVVISWMAYVNEVEGKGLYFSTTDTLQTMCTNCLQVEGFRDSSSVTLFTAQSPSSEPSHPPHGPVNLLRAQSPCLKPSHPPQGPVALYRAQSPSSGPSCPLQSPITIIRVK